MKRLDEIEARAKAANSAMERLAGPREDGWRDAFAMTDRFQAEAYDDVPWLCARLREAMALLAQTAHGDWDRNSAYDEWIARRGDLLAALDEKGPGCDEA